MKKTLLLSLAIVSILTVFLVFYSALPEEEEFYQTPLYIAKVNNNMVAFYHPDGIIYWESDIDVRTLREVDALAFEKGIYIYSQEEMTSLLEDFDS